MSKLTLQVTSDNFTLLREAKVDLPSQKVSKKAKIIQKSHFFKKFDEIYEFFTSLFSPNVNFEYPLQIEGDPHFHR